MIINNKILFIILTNFYSVISYEISCSKCNLKEDWISGFYCSNQATRNACNSIGKYSHTNFYNKEVCYIKNDYEKCKFSISCDQQNAWHDRLYCD